MNEQDWYKSELFSALAAREVTLITASKRQARVWTEQYHKYAESSQNVWPMPDILPIGAWLIRTYESIAQSNDVPLLLNKVQSLTLWENIIRRSDVTDYLISVQATARKVQEAFQLLGEWQVAMADISPVSLDHELFLNWAEEYQAQLTRNRWIDSSQLAGWLINWIEKPDDSINSSAWKTSFHSFSKNLKLLGFHQISTSQQSLFDCFSSFLESKVERLAPRATDVTETFNVEFNAAIDFDNEIRSAAEWAFNKVVNSMSQKVDANLSISDDKRIAIVIPGLEQRRYEVEHILRTQLHPEHLTETFPSKKLYNISVGTAIREFPIIRVALNLIKLTKQAIEREQLTEIMTNDSVGLWREELSEQQRIALKKIAFNLPILGAQRFSLKKFTRLLELELRLNSDKATEFSSLLVKQNTIPEQDTFDGWARTFIKWLELWGWFRGETLSSNDYQLKEQFIQIIHSLRQFNTLFETVRFDQVCKFLYQLVDAEVFQPKSLGEPIAVMGLYEAIGLEFDAVWISGLSNEVLPELPQTNPFIPLSLAQAHDLPGSSPERELIYARSLLKQLRGVSNQITVSYFQFDGDRHLSRSPLLKLFQTSVKHSTESSNLFTEISPQEKYTEIDWYSLPDVSETISLPDFNYEMFNDEAALPLASNMLRSGNQFLTAQSKCPMQGYLAYRVNLSEQEAQVKGIDPRDRGVFVHRVMQRIWQSIKSHAHLVGTPDHELQQLIRSALAQCSDSNINQHSLLAELEQARYFELIYQLMHHEKKREPFVVEHLEYDQTISLNGLFIKTRLDRVDCLQESNSDISNPQQQMTSKERVLIDYKTGRVNQNLWFHERIGEPQLPLYLLSDRTHIKTLCFAQLHHDDVKFVGISESNDRVPKVKAIDKYKDFEDWQTFANHLETKLLELAEEIKTGIASVTPEQKLRACDYCAFDAICRVDELHTKEQNLEVED